MQEKEFYQLLQSNYKSKIINDFKYGYTLTIYLTTKCNLNCTNCQSYCGIEPDWFYSFNELEQSIELLIEYGFPITNICLMGGEPTMHPQIKEICIFLREKLPDVNITLFTNGLLLETLFANDYGFLNQYKISILMSLYPLKKCLDIAKNVEKQSMLNNFSFNIHGIRPYFSKASINASGNNNINERFFTCCSYFDPFSLLLYKNCIYHCNVLFHFKIFGIPENPNDYIDLFNLDDKNLLQKKIIELCKQPNMSCKYCGNPSDISSDEIIFWNIQKIISSNYNSSLLDLYLDNYSLYYSFLHQSLSYNINILKDEYFIKHAKKQEFPSEPLDIFLNRFFYGVGDICIYFDSSSGERLKFIKPLLELQNQSELLNFYLINIDKDKKIKKTVYKIFQPFSTSGQNYFFLETEEKEKINTFLNNSYITKKYFLDINDKTSINQLKNNKNFLINKLKKEKDI